MIDRTPTPDKISLWSGIESCVYNLPHEVEWQEGNRTVSLVHDVRYSTAHCSIV
jgi:hypothetical protein